MVTSSESLSAYEVGTPALAPHPRVAGLPTLPLAGATRRYTALHGATQRHTTHLVSSTPDTAYDMLWVTAMLEPGPLHVCSRDASSATQTASSPARSPDTTRRESASTHTEVTALW